MEKNNKREFTIMEKSIGIGVMTGTIVGIIVGVLTDNIGLWLPFGVSFGIVFGVSFGTQKILKVRQLFYIPKV